jgi:1-deoxy-D-xylulose-5-phosphate reductoisomerase
VDHLRATAAKTLRDLEDVSAAEDDARQISSELVKKGAHR